MPDSKKTKDLMLQQLEFYPLDSQVRVLLVSQLKATVLTHSLTSSEKHQA